MPLTAETVGLLFLLTGVTLLFFLRKPLRYPDNPGSTGFAIAVLGCSLWPLSLGLGYVSPSLEPSIVAWSLRVLAASIISAGWFLLVVDFTNARAPSRRLVAVLAGYLLVEAVLLVTNPVHHLVLQPGSTVTDGVLDPSYGPWFWTQATINYGLMLTATTLLAVESIRASGLYRIQTTVLALAPAPPVVANLVTIFDLADVSYDLTPFGLVGSALFLTWALYRAEFLSLVPIARQRAMEEMRDAVVTLDGENRVVDCNAAARRLFDVDTDYFGMPVRTFFSPVPNRILRRFESVSAVETRISTPTSGGDRHFDLSISPIGTERGGRVGRVIVLRDVTDRTRRERQLVEQNESLDAFASVVSHDIQGPLMMIRGGADLVEETDDVSHTSHVFAGVDRIERLADDIIRLARDGRRVDDLEPVSLEAVAKAAWLSVKSANAELEIRSDRTLLADGSRLQRLLDTLFRNAVEHGSTSPDSRASEGGVDHSGTGVRIAVDALPNGFAVEDDGPGIPPRDRNRVFDRGVTSHGDGTGLGLEIVRQIADAHGWTVAVTEGETGGARFEITGVESADGTDPT